MPPPSPQKSPQKSDDIQIEILDDGTVKITTDPISAANHVNADAFLAALGKMLGGATEVKSRGKTVNAHSHAGTHAHDHDLAGH